MSRPTRNDIEQAQFKLETRRIGGPSMDGRQAIGGQLSGKEWHDLMAGLDLAKRVAPDTCPDCGGAGGSNPNGWNTGYERNCPQCGGRGYVWPDELVMKVSRAILDGPEGRQVPPSWRKSMAKRVLDVLYEVD